MPTLSFGLLQYAMQSGPEKTKQHVLKKLENAFKDRAINFAVLPEMWLGGPARKSERGQWHEIYRHANQELCELAGRHKKNILASQLSLEKGSYFNSALFISGRGKIEHTYHKIHLFTFGGEGRIFDLPESSPSWFTYRGIKIAQIVCYDLRFPELARDLAHQGVQILVVHAQWPESRREHWLTLLKARAIENQIFVVAVNRLGTKKSETFCGDSIAIDPWGKPLLTLKAGKEWGIADLDLKALAQTRKRYPFFRERRLKGILWS